MEENSILFSYNRRSVVRLPFRPTLLTRNTGLQAESILIPYRKGTKWGFCNIQKELVIPCQYDAVRKFKNGIAFVSRHNKWGVITNNGNELINCLYDAIKMNTETILSVK